jgi:hypothetical protein
MESTETSLTTTELTDQVQGVLERANQPLTYFQIQRRLPRPYQERTDELRQILHELAAQGRIHEFAPYRSKAPRFWTREPQQFARQVIVEALNEQARTQRELLLKVRKRLQGVPEERLRQWLSQMLVEGHVRKLPPRLGGRSNLLSAREPQPRDYLGPVFATLLETLGEIYKRLESEGTSRDDFVREAEMMWRGMPWDRLGEAREPRRRRARREENVSAPPFEPAAAATEVNPPAEQFASTSPQETPPGP